MMRLPKQLNMSETAQGFEFLGKNGLGVRVSDPNKHPNELKDPEGFEFQARERRRVRGSDPKKHRDAKGFEFLVKTGPKGSIFHAKVGVTRVP